MSEATYKPGTYSKGAITRVAHSARDAVALTFQGFKPVELEVQAPAAEPELEAPVVEVNPAPSVEVAPRPVAPKPKKDTDA